MVANAPAFFNTVSDRNLQHAVLPVISFVEPIFLLLSWQTRCALRAAESFLSEHPHRLAQMRMRSQPFMASVFYWLQNRNHCLICDCCDVLGQPLLGRLFCRMCGDCSADRMAYTRNRCASHFTFPASVQKRSRDLQ